ncbi:flavodoxin [Mediannikoviicoccus vaginalis]|uniref:flavodoxin n=1 Tax=Mediannikoviicoccus vaginalis TaxID=2899727 RepID=UPI001F00AB80|nr:flavodoxin [Mediannikoviicoccus vaginalis]
MKKIAVVYWSGTGNTEKMANAIVDSAKENGADVSLFESDDFGAEKMDEFDRVAFGCPAMGDEVLEEESFEPMFTACEEKLSGKEIAIFGSYEWNNGEWMVDWESRVNGKGAKLVYPPLPAYDDPDAEAIEKCKELGKALAE